MLGPEFGTFRWLFRSSMKLQVSVLRQKLGSQGYRPTGGPALGRCRGHHATTAAACLQWDRRSAGFGSIRFARWFTEVWLHGEHISDVGMQLDACLQGNGLDPQSFPGFSWHLLLCDHDLLMPKAATSAQIAANRTLGFEALTPHGQHLVFCKFSQFSFLFLIDLKLPQTWSGVCHWLSLFFTGNHRKPRNPHELTVDLP